MSRTSAASTAFTETEEISVKANWHKSTYSGASNGCIEHTKLSADQRAIRDTKNPEFGTLVFDSTAWRAFITGINSGILQI
ncbi:DUF397 domain-containing protein [Streptomyces sp. NPDC046853]|uniref:DUF397 domain-containing protein n=1 Tax=unclassified Streptomyces TaxID=2593676 RepID=UPI0033C55C99